MQILVFLFCLLIFLGMLEFVIHLRNLKRIPIRIHVNGTRGKSSVTRLLAAALKAHGIRVFAKTTGTLPKMILPNGKEYPVYRPSGANIIEQLRIISLSATQEADALVIECMALQPHLQSLCELKLVKATHGVITNARADHLDVMGPKEEDVVRALLGTTPVKAKLYTCERDYIDEFQKVCDDRKSELVGISLEESEAISDHEMAGFSYVEHKDNVALALKISADLGIPRDVALKGMYEVVADVGALNEFNIRYFGRSLIFVNGFAANDPESTEMIWNISLERHQEVDRRVMVVNCRADRPDRTLQLAENITKWVSADYYILIGSGSYPLMRKAVDGGIDSSCIIFAERQSVAQIFEELLSISGHRTLFVGVGNIKGPGLELVKFFKNRVDPSDTHLDSPIPFHSTSPNPKAS